MDPEVLQAIDDFATARNACTRDLHWATLESRLVAAVKSAVANRNAPRLIAAKNALEASSTKDNKHSRVLGVIVAGLCALAARSTDFEQCVKYAYESAVFLDGADPTRSEEVVKSVASNYEKWITGRDSPKLLLQRVFWELSRRGELSKYCAHAPTAQYCVFMLDNFNSFTKSHPQVLYSSDWRLITPLKNGNLVDVMVRMELRSGGRGSLFSPVEKSLMPLDADVKNVTEWAITHWLRRRHDLDVAVWLETVPLSPDQPVFQDRIGFDIDYIRPTIYAALGGLIRREQPRKNVALLFSMNEYFELYRWKSNDQKKSLEYTNLLNNEGFSRCGKVLLAEQEARDIGISYDERPKVDWVRSIDRIWSHICASQTPPQYTWPTMKVTDIERREERERRDLLQQLDRLFSQEIQEILEKVKEKRLLVIFSERRNVNDKLAKRVMRGWTYHCNYHIDCAQLGIVSWSDLLRAMCEAIGASLSQGDDIDDFVSAIGAKPFRLLVTNLDNMSNKDQEEALRELNELLKRLNALEAFLVDKGPYYCILLTSAHAYDGASNIDMTKFHDDGGYESFQDIYFKLNKYQNTPDSAQNEGPRPPFDFESSPAKELFLLFPSGADTEALRWIAQCLTEPNKMKPNKGLPPDRALDRDMNIIKVVSNLFGNESQASVDVDATGRIRVKKAGDLSAPLELAYAAAEHMYKHAKRHIRALRPRSGSVSVARDQKQQIKQNLREVGRALHYIHEETPNISACVSLLWKHLASISASKLVPFAEFAAYMRMILKLADVVGGAYTIVGRPGDMDKALEGRAAELFAYGAHAAESLYMVTAACEPPQTPSNDIIVVSPVGEIIRVAPPSAPLDSSTSSASKQEILQSVARCHYHAANLFYLRSRYSDARGYYFLALDYFLAARSLPFSPSPAITSRLRREVIVEILQTAGGTGPGLSQEALWTARVLLGLAVCFRKQDALSLSGEYLSALETVVTKWGNRRLSSEPSAQEVQLELAHYRRHQASILRRQGNLDGAIVLFGQASEQYKRLGVPLYYIECQQSLGDALGWRGTKAEYAKARTLLTEVQQHFQLIGLHQNTASVQRALGEIDMMADDHEEARRRYADAMEKYYTYGNALGQARLLRLRAQVSRIKARKETADPAEKAAEWTRAKKYLEKSLAIYSESQIRSGIGRTRKNYGDIARDMGLFDVAITHYLAAVQNLDEYQDVLYRAEALRGWGITNLKRGRPTDARHCLTKAQQTFEVAGAEHHWNLCQRDLLICEFRIEKATPSTSPVSDSGATPTDVKVRLKEIQSKLRQLHRRFAEVKDQIAADECRSAANEIGKYLKKLQ